MRIYIAGASKELDRVKSAYAIARELGFELTYDWVAEVEAHNGVTNEGLDDGERRRLSTKEVYAVVLADVFWLLCPQGVGVGAFVELGVAVAAQRLAYDRHIIVASGPTRRTIFGAQADFEVPTDEDGANIVRELRDFVAAARFKWLWQGMSPAERADVLTSWRR